MGFEKLWAEEASHGTLSRGAQVVLTTGAPGAGKSTLADVLVEKFGYVRLELDELRAELGDRYNQSLTLPAVALRDERLREALTAGRQVVLSDTNASAEFRRLLIEQVLALVSNSDEVLVVHFAVPAEECKRRNQGRGQGTVPDEVIDRMVDALRAHPPERDADDYVLAYIEVG